MSTNAPIPKDFQQFSACISNSPFSMLKFHLWFILSLSLLLSLTATALLFVNTATAPPFTYRISPTDTHGSPFCRPPTMKVFHSGLKLDLLLYRTRVIQENRLFGVYWKPSFRHSSSILNKQTKYMYHHSWSHSDIFHFLENTKTVINIKLIWTTNKKSSSLIIEISQI